ncbi:helix-turn-helix transcriptional regulator [Kordia jejudonensis]|uniref:helix-turn-helix transcriptional regulator n=1 Tax=Kordia jejudonensis TaxID=1348245 RepID=UPI0006297B75|nr:LuxR C-terminal-related transcriptional regulator [Kordia jejudonensis]
MKKLAITILFFVGSFSAIGQVKDSISDALKLQIEKAATNVEKIPLLLKLADHMSTFDVDAARQVALNAQKIIETNTDENVHYQKQKATLFQTLAVCDELQDNLVASLENLQKSIDIFSSINDSLNLGKSYRIRGSLSIKNRDTIAGRKYFRKSIDIHKKINDSVGISKSYIYLGVSFFYDAKKRDSMPYYTKLAKTYDNSLETQINADANLASFFLYDGNFENARMTYESLIGPHKKLKKYLGLSSCYQSLGSVYAFLNNKEKSLQALDSAIAYSKLTGNKSFLVSQYESRRNINYHFKDYKAAIKDFNLFKKYYDSVNDLQEAKRFTELELSYEFEKEKELATIALDNEQAKNTLYFILLFITIIGAAITFILIRKNSKQRLHITQNELQLKEVEKLKADLALANREKELKKVVIENSITEEVLNKTLDDIKQIITFENERERQAALKSLSASLLSETTAKSSTSSLQNYLDKVNIDFKIRLDSQFSVLKPKEKELLCMMKLGLSSAEISKLLNTTLASIKSSRYRIRKKLNLDSSDDIIAFIETQETSNLNS